MTTSYRHFIREGTRYRLQLTSRWLFAALATITLLGLSIPAWLWAQYEAALAAVVTGTIIGLSNLKKYLIADVGQCRLYGQIGMLAAEFNIPFDSILGFDISSLRHNRCLNSVYLRVRHRNGSEERQTLIAHGFSEQVMQAVRSELEELINLSPCPRENRQDH